MSVLPGQGPQLLPSTNPWATQQSNDADRMQSLCLSGGRKIQALQQDSRRDECWKGTFSDGCSTTCYCIQEAPIVQKTLGLNWELGGTEFMAGMTHLRFIREANDSFIWARQTHTPTQLQSATSLVYKFCHSDCKLRCRTCLLRKYCHSCKISSSSYFITIDCTTFAGIIYYEGP